VPRRIYPTLQEVIETQRILIDEYGGLHGIPDRGLLESAVFRPRSGYYRDLFDEAAALLESLAGNQAFLDGNKRTAFVITDAFLRINGHYPDVETAAAHRFINTSIARKQFNFTTILAWLKAHVETLDP
jgi:death on curing protein